MKRITLFTSVIFLILSITGCKEELTTTLTPARNIEGTWVTTFPVKFYIETDFCSSVLELVATEERVINWEIEWVDADIVFITVNFTPSNFQIVNENCNPTGYVPDITLGFLHGLVSSSGMTVSEWDNESNVFGKFTFTTDLMQGTWDDSWCLAYCQYVYTETNQYKLNRQ